MDRSRALRLGGFAAAIVASAALIGAASGATGAYFTDSHDGSINATVGKVSINVSPADLKLNFNGLLPGEFQSKDISYRTTGTGAQDIWLVLPTDGTANALNGQPQSGAVPLGRYGHFAVTAPDGSFTSYNLASPSATSPGPVCAVDSYGRGGSDTQAQDTSDYIDYCPVPSAILLSWNVPANAPVQTATITFGYTKLLKDQGVGWTQIAPFKIVATQHGVMPNDPNN